MKYQRIVISSDTRRCRKKFCWNTLMLLASFFGTWIILATLNAQFQAKLLWTHEFSKRINSSHIIKAAGSSDFDYTYNPAILELYDDQGKAISDLLIIRTQNTKNNDQYQAGPSQMVLAKPVTGNSFFVPNQLNMLSAISEKNIILDQREGGENESFGNEDPRVSYRGGYARLAIAVTSTPEIKESWIRLGPCLVDQNMEDIEDKHKYDENIKNFKKQLKTPKGPDSINNKQQFLAEQQYVKFSNELSYGTKYYQEDYYDLQYPTRDLKIEPTKSGAVLWRDKEGQLPVLFWGDSSIYLAIATDMSGTQYKTFDTLIKKRNNSFDSFLIESGPPPLLLEDGNIFLVYNSAQTGFNTSKPGCNNQYNVGYVILDSKNPLKIIQRSDKPILSPDEDWENGGNNFDEPCFVPIAVFLEGMKRIGPNRFLAVYGACDTYLGMATFDITILKNSSSEQKYFVKTTKYGRFNKSLNYPKHK